MEIFEMEKEFNDLMKAGQELIKKLKKEQVADDSKTKRWNPKVGEDYWFFENDGNLFSRVNYNSECDVFLKSIGNCFKTEEEAQKEFDRRIAEQELLDLADYDEKEREGWIIVFDFDLKFVPSNFSRRYACFPRFASEESCQKAIEQLGEDKLKLVFRID